MTRPDAFTVEFLRSILHYNPTSGVFTRLQKTGPNCNIGPILGRHHSGYQFIRVLGKKYAAHRLAWFYINGVWPTSQIDHINGDCGDNRLANLRQASCQDNSLNRKRYVNNNSGYKGVGWHKAVGKWQARIYASRRMHHLGWFLSPEEAAKAYDEAALRLHGGFARLNGDRI